MPGLKEQILKRNRVYYNGRIYTQAGDFIVADSMAVSGNVIAAVGRRLEKDEDFKKYEKINLKNHTVLPGFVDSHTHLYFIAQSLDNVKLDGLISLEQVLQKIKKHARRLGRDEWVVGEGFSVDRWKKYILPDRYMLDKVTGGRPAALFSKDQHLMWVNSKALDKAGIKANSPQPNGGHIDRLENNEPSGILREIPGFFPVYSRIKTVSPKRIEKLYRDTLKMVYTKGVTGVHSLDGAEAFYFFDKISRKQKIGLRINYYAPVGMLEKLKNINVKHGYGNEYFRLAGIKVFMDGSLGSQTAYCFNKYIGSKDNFGLEVTSSKKLQTIVRQAARLSLPCAVHAIGDKAISDALDSFEKSGSQKVRGSYRIEHLQMIRRKDLPRLKRLGVVAAMQPSHCPSDIKLIKKYWGKRGRNCYIFNTLLKNKIPLIFGSDAPIEPLDPIAGISAAVNRTAPDSREPFYPKERISIKQAVYNFTAAAATAVGQQYETGYLLPGYKADFIILSDDIYKTAGSKIKKLSVLATFFDGQNVFKHKSCGLSL